MKLRISYECETGEGSEFFSHIEDALGYLEELQEREDPNMAHDFHDERLDFFDTLPDKISLTKKENSLPTYLENGFEVTYEGKTGYTLERKVVIDDN